MEAQGQGSRKVINMQCGLRYVLGAFLHSSHLIGTTALKVVRLCHWTDGDVEAQRGGVIAHTAGQCISQDLT